MQTEIKCEYEKLLPITELKAHPKNRNKHPEDQIARLARVIEYQGWRHPIIVSNLSGLIVAGHGRLAAAQKLGLEEVPVDYQDFESEEQEYAFLQSDNAIALWAEMDLSGINADIPDLGPDFDIDMLGIKNFVIDLSEVNYEPEELDGSDGEKKYLLEVQFTNDMDMNDVKDDLLSRGYIVKVK